jgi:hypothetical protein
VPVDLPRGARLANPSFDGTSRWLVALGAVAGVAAAVWIPGVGWLVGLLAVALGWVASRRRRTIGAYEGVDALVVRNWFATRAVPWMQVDRVEERRDPWLPVFRVGVLRYGTGGSLSISGLRHASSATPAPVLTVTKLVRDARERRAREPWNF